MRSAVLVVALLVLLAACAGDDQVAQDPAPGDDATPERLVQQGVPIADGEVRTRGPVTVIQRPGAGVEVCLGPAIAIYPPQCGGPPLLDWSWETTGRAMFEEEAGTRFGQYGLTGTFDGEALTVTGAVPAALYDAAPVEVPTPGPPTREFSEAGLVEIADEASSLPGATGAAPDGTGRVLVDVVYDDGSIQAYADRAWGEGVVLVSAALVDAG